VCSGLLTLAAMLAANGATDCRSSSPIGDNVVGSATARTPPLRCRSAGFPTQVATLEACRSAGVSEALASQLAESRSTPHRIAPKRFSGVVRFWKERVNGIDASPVPFASPVPLPGVLSPTVPEGLATVPEAIAIATPILSSQKTLKDWSPPTAGQLSPTPRRLVNLLEGDESLDDEDDDDDGDASPAPCFHATPDTDTFARWNLGSCTPGTKPRAQHWIDISSDSTASRTPERSNLFTPSWEASSRASVTSIATPDKFGQDSPVVETEMELMLDLANHLSCDMMDRLTEVLHSAHSSPAIVEEEEDANSEGSGAVEEEEEEEEQEVAELASVEPFFIRQYRQAVFVTAAVAMLGLSFAGGFVTRGAMDGYSNVHKLNHHQIEIQATATEVHQHKAQQSLVGFGWPQLETERAMPVNGTHLLDMFPHIQDEYVREDLQAMSMFGMDMLASYESRVPSQQADPFSNMKGGKEYTVVESISAGLWQNLSLGSPQRLHNETFSSSQPWLEVDETAVSELGQALLELGKEVAAQMVPASAQVSKLDVADARSPATHAATQIIAQMVPASAQVSKLDVADARAPATHAATQIIQEWFGPDVDAAEQRLILDLDSAAGFLIMSSTAPRKLEHARAAEERLTGEVVSAELERRCLAAFATWRARGNTSSTATHRHKGVLFAEQACRVASLGAKRDEYNVEGNEFDWALAEATY